jgi:hypothetical protein
VMAGAQGTTLPTNTTCPRRWGDGGEQSRDLVLAAVQCDMGQRSQHSHKLVTNTAVHTAIPFE